MYKIAGLPSLHFTKQCEEKHHFVISACVAARPGSCPHCGHTVVSRHTHSTQGYVDTPIEGKRVLLLVRQTRYKCESKACKATFTPRLPEMHDSRMITKRLETWLETEFRYTTDLRLCYLTGLQPKTLGEMRSEYYDKLWATHEIRAPLALGIDEVKFGGTYKTVFTSIDSTPNRVIDLLDSYSVATIVQHLRTMPGIDQVQFVCRDDKPIMAEACRKALPHATVVLDRFHVTKLVNEVFAGQLKKLNTPPTQSTRQPSAAKERGKPLRTLLLKKNATLKDNDRREVQRALDYNPHVREAYVEKEAFYDVYECKTRSEAVKAYRLWKNNLTPERSRVWRRLIHLIATHRMAFFAYFSIPEGLSNGFTEWANQRLKELNRNARSMNFELLRRRAIFECQQITARPPLPARESYVEYTADFSPPADHGIKDLSISAEAFFLSDTHTRELKHPT